MSGGLLGLDLPRIQQPDDSGTDQGAALAQTYQAVTDYMRQQQAKSADMGLWDDATGLPTGKGLLSAGQQYGSGLLMGSTEPGFRAFHGSPYDFERFDTSKIGTGEGNQAFGYGLYAAEAEPTAQSYKGGGYSFQGKRLDPQAGWSPESSAAGWFEQPKPGETMGDMIARRAQELQDHGDFMAGSTDSRNHGSAQMYYNAAEKLRALDPADWKQAGHMYEVNIGADPNSMLQWDQTVGQHPPAVRDKLLDMGYGDADRGADVYSHMSRGPAGDVGASQRLQDAGIPGISYFDAGSRGGGQGTKNHVIFDANTIDILRKYGIAGLITGGGAAAGSQQQPSQ